MRMGSSGSRHPVHEALMTGHTSQARSLLTSSDIDLQDDWGNAPLHVALQKGEEEVAMELLNRGARCNVASRGGETPLHIAARRGYLSLCELMVEGKGCQVDAVARGGKTPLHEAVFEGRHQVVRYLLQHGADINRRTEGEQATPLHLAVMVGAHPVIDCLLQNGAVLNARTREGATALYSAVCERDVKSLHMLLEKGADVNLSTYSGSTLLHAASSRGFLHGVQTLLEQGLDANARSRDDWTPLHEAAVCGYQGVVQLLLTHGAYVDRLAQIASPPVARFVQRHVHAHLPHSSPALVHRVQVGTSVLHLAAVADNSDESQRVLRSLLEFHAPLYVFDRRGRSALYWALLNGNLRTIHKLLVAGSPFMITDTEGNSAVFPASSSSHRLNPNLVHLPGRSHTLGSKLTPNLSVDILILLLQHGMSPARMVTGGQCLQVVCLTERQYPRRLFKAVLQSGHNYHSTVRFWAESLNTLQDQGRLDVCEWISDLMITPPSLIEICVHLLRRCLLQGTCDHSIWGAAHQLPLPPKLINSILLTHLQSQSLDD